MENIFAKYPKTLFWAVVCITVAICWGVRLLMSDFGVWNSGIAFNLAVPTTTIYTITAVVLGGLVGWLMRASYPKAYLLWGIGLIVGGGITNFTDRVFNNGRVWDYIPFGPFGHFNLADVCVTAGLLILLYNWWKEERVSKQ
jgi:lipoprotein signal peptidase